MSPDEHKTPEHEPDDCHSLRHSLCGPRESGEAARELAMEALPM